MTGIGRELLAKAIRKNVFLKNPKNLQKRSSLSWKETTTPG